MHGVDEATLHLESRLLVKAPGNRREDDTRQGMCRIPSSMGTKNAHVWLGMGGFWRQEAVDVTPQAGHKVDGLANVK